MTISSDIQRLRSALSASAMVAVAPDVSQVLPPREWRQRPEWAEKRLLVAPQRGSWCIASPERLAFWRSLARPRSGSELLSLDAPSSTSNVSFDSGEAERWLAILWERGFITINGRQAPLPTVREEAPKEPTFIALHMAKGCNFRCSYCYNESVGTGTLAADEALSLLEKACRELKGTVIHVDFLGGEPLLAWDNIVQVMREARALGERYSKQFCFMMQTNGALLTADKVRTLIEHRVGVGVSLDGPKALHDARRRLANGAPTHELVVERMMEARELGLDVNPLAVVCAPDSYVELLDYFVGELGLRTMRFNNFSVLGRARQSQEAKNWTPAAYARGFLDMVDRALEWSLKLQERLRIYDLGWYLQDLVIPERSYMCRRSPCGLGEAIVSYGPDGNLYACEEYEERTRASLCLGRSADVNLGDLKGTSPFWRSYKPRTVDNVPRCSRCLWRKWCGGGCSHKALAFYGSWYREDPFCAFYERIFPGLMWRVGEDKRYLQYLSFSTFN